MKRALTRIQDAYRCWHFVNGERIFGPPPDLRGDVTGLRGEVTGLRGDADACELTDADREAGVRVRALIAETALAMVEGAA